MGLYQVDQQCLGLKLVFTSGIAACRGHWQHALQLLADMQDADSLSLSCPLALGARLPFVCHWIYFACHFGFQSYSGMLLSSSPARLSIGLSGLRGDPIASQFVRIQCSAGCL